MPLLVSNGIFLYLFYIYKVIDKLTIQVGVLYSMKNEMIYENIYYPEKLKEQVVQEESEEER